ncbi:hypothetical protein F4778DRAFT_734328 [Xylariomycetidae sp. FL2044]|nr:hypothetical protein F4778DRAFT_734328 [Xylariomycetidae sp. FL2044]
MDHFNATVSNGSMISTRRGFQVTRQKHRGIAFVNASVQDRETPELTLTQPNTLPIPHTQLTFITDDLNRKRLAPPRRQARRTKSPSQASSRSASSRSRLGLPKNTLRRSLSISSSSSSISSQETRTPEPPDSTWSSSISYGALPAWASYNLPREVPDSHERFLFMALAFAPIKGEPSDDHCGPDDFPLDAPERYIPLMQDPSSLHCALTLGSLFDAIRSGNTDTPDLNALESQLSSIIQRRLNKKSRSKVDRNVTIHAIATLAILAGYLGKYDHWHVHCNGLLNLIDVVGGQQAMDYRTITTIRKADLVGALSSATKPRLPFVGRYDLPPYAISLTDDDKIRESLKQHLFTFGISPIVVDSVAEAAIFNHYAALAKDLKGSPEYSVRRMIEQYYCLGYMLLSEPEPLRPLDEALSPTTTQDLAIHMSPTLRDTPIDAAASIYNKAIESILRILSLMCIREPVLDLPCGVNTMLALLEQHLITVLNYRRTRFSLTETTLQQSRDIKQRPTLICICVTFELLWSMYRSSKTNTSSLEVDTPKVSRELLRMVLGRDISANPNLMSTEDLDVCRLITWSHIRGQDWDYVQEIRRMLEGIDH